MIADALDALDEQQLRQLLRNAQQELSGAKQTVAFKQAVIDKITHENALLKRLKFAAKSEAFTAEQKSLLDEALDTDLAAVAAEIEQLQPQPKAGGDKQSPKRQTLPAQLPRCEVRHEPDSTECRCGNPMRRIGEDISEKLDYQPGVFTVERHIRGKWVCRCCSQRGEGRLVQAPVEAHVIDKGLPTTGLLAQVLVAKFLDHLPLYRQEAIFARAGHAIARSTLAQWVGECGVQLQPLVDALAEELLRQRVLHADETPVAMLKPGQGKTHRAYLWSYCTTQTSSVQAVVFDFAETRGGQHVQPIRYLLDRSLCFRPERELAGSDFHRRINRALARHTQQLGGEPHPADCTGAAELAVRRQLARRQAGRSGDEPGALGQAQRA